MQMVSSGPFREIRSLITLKRISTQITIVPWHRITSDQGSSPMFIVGFADGLVKLFDRRLAEEDAIVRLYHGQLEMLYAIG